MSNDDEQQKQGITVSPGRCLLGASIAGALAYALYWLTANIASTFIGSFAAMLRNVQINLQREPWAIPVEYN